MSAEPLAVDAHGYVLRPDASAPGFKGNPRLSVGVPLEALNEMEYLVGLHGAAVDRSATFTAIKAWAKHIREKASGTKAAAIGPWKEFAWADVDARETWVAQTDGIALDRDEVARGLERGGCIYAASEERLIAAAVSIGCNRLWIQRAGRPGAHFRLTGAVLEKALALCARGGS